MNRILKSDQSISDPEAVVACIRAGIGTMVDLAVGGKTDDRHGTPLVARFTVHGVFGGRFEETEVRHGGIRHFDQGPTAIVDFVDSGEGIVRQNLSKIFRAGFSGANHRPGLGLTVCQQIIEQHQGAIRVESCLGQGTKFSLEFPVL